MRLLILCLICFSCSMARAARTAPLSAEEFLKAYRLSIQIADQWIEKNKKELAIIARREQAKKQYPADAEMKAQLQMLNNYLTNYQEKYRIYLEMRELEDTLKKKRRKAEKPTAEEKQKVKDLSQAYDKALNAVNTLKIEFNDRYKHPIKDPIDIVLEKIFEPDPLAKGAGNR